ncbi:MAG TPA: hypothetical protein VNO30_36690 [Kofleriaceae bacterium]|nr:hypothetical protein [Kofleriaceae bacterium]
MVDCPVVEIADGREVPQIVAAAAALVFDVVQIQPDVPATSGHRAAVAVPREHLLPLASRDCRGRPLRHRSIERTEMHGVAGGALGHCAVDFDVSPAAVLPRTLAVRTLLERDLVGGCVAARTAPLIATVAVCPAKQGRDQLVIREPLAVLLGSERVQLAPEIVRLGRDLERERLAVQTRLGLVGGQVPGPVPGHHRLDLTQALAPRRLEPHGFSIGHGHARQLAHRRMRELALLQRLRDQGKLGYRAGHAKTLDRRARRVAQRALQILEQTPETVRPPQLHFLGVTQQVRLLGIERGSPRRNAAELLVYSRPLRRVLALPGIVCCRVIYPPASTTRPRTATRHAISVRAIACMNLLIRHIDQLTPRHRASINQ